MLKISHHQSLKLLPLAALLIITPLLSSSLRFKYLYFVVNILIIALGLEAGLFSFLLKSAENYKINVSQKPVINISAVKENCFQDKEIVNISDDAQSDNKEKSCSCSCSSEKVFVEVNVEKIGTSNPSIFFIGDSEIESSINIRAEEFVGDDDDGDEEVENIISEQELFHKAEIFIGNFYKQLKMQREESWKKLHGGLSQEAY